MAGIEEQLGLTPENDPYMMGNPLLRVGGQGVLPGTPPPVAPTDPAAPAATAQAGGYDRKGFVDRWMGSTGSIDDFLRDNADVSQGVSKVAGGKGDKFQLPTGEIMDAQIAKGVNGENAQHGWTPAGGNQGAPGGGGAAGSSNAAAGGPGAYGPMGGQIYQSILALLKRGEAPVSDSDPAIQGQFAPISAKLQQGARRTREAAAQRLAAEGLNQGGNGGALDAETNAINESLGGQEASEMGKLLGGELQARRADVVNALQFAQGEERMALQKQLADIDANLKQQGLGLESQRIGNQNQQFYDKFSADLASENNSLDNQLTRYLLGG